MALQLIERIPTPSPQVFRERYLTGDAPVVFTDFLSGQPILEISAPERAASVLGHIPLKIKTEYTRNIFRFEDEDAEAPAALPRESTVAEYLDLVAREPGTTLLATENRTHEAISERLRIPDGYVVTPPDDHLGPRSFMFFGNAGNFSSMHFDGDVAPLLHFQVFGHKRHIIARPQVAKKLCPVGLYSSIMLGNFSEADKLSFASYLDAWDIVLSPGETLFMPPQYWHHVEYLDTSFSVNMRFGRNKYMMFFGDQVHRDYFRQNIAAKMTDPAKVETVYRDQFESLKNACRRRYETPEEKFWEMKRMLRSIYREICRDSIQAEYSISHEALEFDLIHDHEQFYQRLEADNGGHWWRLFE